MQDIFSVEGKHILITGASSGLGAHMASMLAGRGARISAAARRVERLQGHGVDHHEHQDRKGQRKLH